MTGKDKAKEIYKNLSPGNKNVFINMEAIEALPDEYDVIITDVKFDPSNLESSFSNVGTKSNPSWYPKTELIYDIAEKRGVIGHGEKTIETIKDEVDINPMLMKPIEAEPTMRIMPVGVRVTKSSKVLCEDGTYRPSSPCTNEFNYWDRAVLDWLSEEKYTDSYSKPGKYGYKYNTPILRRLRYMELKKFAIQQAETKAFVKTVRELAGLPTGFKTEDLKSGKLTLFKIVRSKSIIKLETAARIDAIRGGKTEEIENKINQVYEIEAPKDGDIEMHIVGEEKKPVVKEIKEEKDAPEFRLEPEIIEDDTPEKEKDFLDIDYNEKKEWLKKFSYHVLSDTDKKDYLKNILICYIDENGENIKTLEKLNNALDAAKYKIINYETLPESDLLAFIKKIEKQTGIKKLSHTV